MGNRSHGGGDANARRRSAASGHGGCGIVGTLLLLPIVGVGFLVLWLNGNILGWRTERDLAAFYDAVGRGDNAAAARAVPAADEADVRLWARDEAEGHGPPVAIRTVAYDFRAEFGEYGWLFYLVRYRDGSEEHNVIFNRQGQPLRLPPHGAEQGIRRCHPRLAPDGRIEFGETRRSATDWIMPYAIVQPRGARAQFTAYANTHNLNLLASGSNGTQVYIASCTR